MIAFAYYFAEGAPIGFIWWALPTLLRHEGAQLDTIATFTAILTLPWVFKFLWAPLIDVFRRPGFGFMRWIGVSQLFMCITLVPLLFLPLKENIFWWGFFLLLHSFSAATQDVSVDALIINVVIKKEKGMLNATMQAGMLAGRSIFGGGALILAPKYGLHTTIGLMILAILVTMSLLPFIKEPAIAAARRERLENFRKKIVTTFRSASTAWTIAFALTAAAAFEAAAALSGPFLTDQKVTMESIGIFFGLPVVACMLIGGFAGGFLSDLLSRKRSVAFFLLGFVAMVLVIAVAGMLSIEVSHIGWMTMFAVMYVFIGMFTTSSYALFMDATDPHLGATQFSTYMAATNGCEAWAVWSAGMIAAAGGYSYAFAAMCAVSVLSLFFLRRISSVSPSAGTISP